ncbi:hypothetical protein ACTXT7_016619, partial [Hymenolepis weldensis]
IPRKTIKKAQAWRKQIDQDARKVLSLAELSLAITKNNVSSCIQKRKSTPQENLNENSVTIKAGLSVQLLDGFSLIKYAGDSKFRAGLFKSYLESSSTLKDEFLCIFEITETYLSRPHCGS